MADGTTAARSESLATKLSDRQVRLIAAVTLAMGGGETPDLSYEEWCEAETLVDQLDA